MWSTRRARRVASILEKPPEVERYQTIFNHLVAKALDPDESKTLIAEVAADLA